MSVDLTDAAERHWTDAELLRARQRWPNADQFFGLAAECGLKAVMNGLGMPLRPDGVPQKKRHRVHIDSLWSEFSMFASGHGEAHYAALLAQQNPFADWSVDQRYWGSGAISEQRVESHRQGAREVRRVLHQARVDGLL